MQQMMNGHRVKGLGQVERLLRPLRTLEATYRAFDAAEKELTSAIGVPICVSNCGKCCATNAVVAMDIETQMIASYLMGNVVAMQKVLSLCEGWLLDKSGCKVFGISGMLNDDQKRTLLPEVNGLMLRSPCPLLTSDKGCLIHEMRPLVCRAYGVTHMPDKACPRPLSRMESEDVRAHIGVNTPSGFRLRKMVEIVKQQAVGLTNVRFLATGIYMMLMPQKFNEYGQSGTIPTAKLIVMSSSSNIIFQNDLENSWKAKGLSLQDNMVSQSSISKEREE